MNLYKLNEENNIRNSALKGKIVAVAVSVVMFVLGMVIGVKFIPDRSSGNNDNLSEPEIITTEKITTTNKTECQKAETTVADAEISFTVPFPEKANGIFVIDFFIKNEDGSTYTESTDIILIPEMNQINKNIKGSGENVYVVVVLTNMNTGKKAQIGSYFFNFVIGEVNVQTEDINGAFEAVGGFDNASTTEAPPEPSTEYIKSTQATTFDPSLVGIFDHDANDGIGYFDVYDNYYPYFY